MPFSSFNRLLAVGFLLICFVLPQAARAETQWYSLNSDPYYADVRARLLVLVNTEGFHKSNEFCVVGARYPDEKNTEEAYVYWPTQDWLINWEEEPDNPASMDTSHYLDLSKDVVPSENDINGSDYLTTPDWVDNVIHKCNRFGDHYHVTRSSGGWKSPKDFPQFSALPAQLQGLLNPPKYLWSIESTVPPVYKAINRFCVVAQQDRSWLVAYIYWTTEQRLIAWIPSPEDKYDSYALLGSVLNVDLKVSNPAKNTVGDETDQVPEDFTMNILAACKKYGINFVIQNRPKFKILEAK